MPAATTHTNHGGERGEVASHGEASAICRSSKRGETKRRGGQPWGLSSLDVARAADPAGAVRLVGCQALNASTHLGPRPPRPLPSSSPTLRDGLDLLLRRHRDLVLHALRRPLRRLPHPVHLRGVA